MASSPEPTPVGVPALVVYPAHPSALSKEHLQSSYGKQDRVIKTHHWLLHFPAHLEEHGKTASCFTAESKHKDVPRHAVSMYDTKKVERWVFDEEFHSLGDPANLCTDPGLLKASPLPKKMLHIGRQIWPFAQDAFRGHTLMLQHGGTVSKGDVVLLHGPPNWKCGKVMLIWHILGNVCLW